MNRQGREGGKRTLWPETEQGSDWGKKGRGMGKGTE